MSISRVDVAVVGASVAGATAAYLLGKAGLRVLLIDRCTFPRRKPCGEGLSRLGQATLQRIGLWEPVAPPHLPYSGYELRAGTTHRTIKLVEPGVTVRRDLFDALLVNRALEWPTVSGCFGAAVSDVESEGGRLRIGDRSVQARHLVIADGSNSRLADSIGILERRLGPKRVGVARHFAGTFYGRSDIVKIVIEDLYEMYCTPLRGGLLNVNILARSDGTINPRDVLLSDECRRKAFRACSFEGAPIEPPIGRAAIGNVQRQASKGVAVLVGDACEEFDPIGGMGMTHAIMSAELAAGAILKMEYANCSRRSALIEYAHRREVIARRFRAFSRLSFMMMRSASRVPGLLNLAASPIGEAVVRRFVS